MIKRVMQSAMAALAVSVACLSSPAQAQSQTVSVEKLQQMTAAEQSAVLKYLAEDQTSAKIKNTTEVVKHAEQALDIGERFGRMMGGAAREVGVAVNDFITTPVGMLAAGLVIWHFMGGVLVHVSAGIIFVLFAVWCGTWVDRRERPINVTYTGERTWYGSRVKEYQPRKAIEDSSGYVIYYAIVAVCWAIITFTY